MTKQKTVAGSFFLFFLIMMLAFSANSALGQRGGGALWTKVEGSSRSGERLAKVPEKYSTFRLEPATLKRSMAGMPVDGGRTRGTRELIMNIPMPDGSISRFRMVETQVLADHLRKAFPDWKTFSGVGVDDPTASGRFDWTVQEFHGYIFTDKGTVYIEPAKDENAQTYRVFYKQDYGEPDGSFHCSSPESFDAMLRSSLDSQIDSPEFSFGAAMRTYRIAISATGEWSRNASSWAAGQTAIQTRTLALAAITTAINRINGVFNREAAVNFVLVNPPIAVDANNIVFDDPATDPYDNTDNIPQLGINQTTDDARVGTGNYDIGHLFGTGGGGVAGTPSVCQAGFKAQGYSARGTNLGDPFVVDYVAHEIGHQLGANHTYNTSDPGACSTREPTSAYEVGSGSTLMSYVGICNADRNTQQNVDTVFPSLHIRSMTEITTNLSNAGAGFGGSCGTTAGVNAVPTVSAGASFTIPALTPFTLTATGADADAGDVANLLYSWEEFDLSTASGPNGVPAGTYDVDTDGTLRPLFRAYPPTASSTRNFPNLFFVLNPAGNAPAGSNQPPLTYTGNHPTGISGAVCQVGLTCIVGENLPTQTRAMNFRVSVRDRRGGIVDAGTTVNVTSTAGPFRVTSQDTAFTWPAGATRTVTWNVANTTAAPVSAANVNILLSTDGGLTFPITLASNTPNDGAQAVIIPNGTAATATARIKIQGAGNIFFDINNVNFTITTFTASGVTLSGRVLTRDGRGLTNAVVNLTDPSGATFSLVTGRGGAFEFSGIEAGQTYILNVVSERFQFSPRVITVDDNVQGFDIVAD